MTQILVFDDPMHRNGGCIFADPSEILPEVGGGSTKRRQQPITHSNKGLAMREDEDFIAVLQAYFSRKRH